MIEKRSFNEFLVDTFAKMFIGLLITALVAMAIYTTGLYENIYLIIGGCVVELILCFVLSFGINKMLKSMAYAVYILYCAVSGIAFSIYPAIYEGGSIMLTIFITAGLFGLLSLYGYTTKRDLRTWRTYLFIGLIGSLISSIVNIFLRNDMMDIIVSIVSIIVFLGYTAYDVQKLYDYYAEEGENGNLSIYGALQLYLDFVNLFIDLMRFFGKRKDD